MTEMPEKPEMPEKNERRDKRFVDELLDSALAHYAQAEPRPGLEARLLARLRSEPEPAAFGWRWLPLAAAATVVVAAVLYFAGSRESRPPEVSVQPKPAVAPAGTGKAKMPIATAPVAQQASDPVASRAAAKQPSAAGASMRAADARASISARRQEFFQPTPVSEQEAALMRLVRQTPAEELKMLARQNRAEPIPELRVDALDIPPLVVGEPDSQ